MLHSLHVAIVFVGYGLLIFPKYLYCRFFIKDPRKQHDYTLGVVKTWSRKLYKSLDVPFNVTGNTNLPDGPVYVVSNHLSMMDIPAIILATDKTLGFVAKKELEHAPLFSKWVHLTKSVFINRKDMRQSLKAIQKATENLKDGYSLAVFPEGTRGTDDTIGEFKKGSLRPALKSNTPIIPIALKNTEVLFEDLKKLIIKKPSIYLHYFDPIYPDQLSSEEKKNLHVYLRDLIDNHNKSF